MSGRAGRQAVAAFSGMAVLLTLGLSLDPSGNAATRSAGSGASGATAFVRVDSVGFLHHDRKRAYLMTEQAISGATFAVVDSVGDTVASGTVGSTSRGRWSATFPDVYPLNFSSLDARGEYTIQVTGPVEATSPPFRITSRSTLNGGIVRKGVKFFQVQRDGSDQDSGPLHRKPSHLSDKHASVYKRPHFAHPNRSDVIDGSKLHHVASHATADVKGGWFDAGDYLKFTHTAAYADTLLEASERALGHRAPPALIREARHGEKWLRKMWREHSKTLYLQVGIGSGNRAGTFYGDHDLWRLPQADAHNTKHRDRYATRHRPVFRAAKPGHHISPNLVGRVSAAFALAAQNDAKHHRHHARHELHAATTLYAMAKTKHPPHPLVTSEPFEYYPEDSWRDDMALGGAEITLAKLDLGRDPTSDLKSAAKWAARYIAKDAGEDTFNLYDTSALAEADLTTALRQVGSHPHLDVTRSDLIGDLRRQVRSGLHQAKHDPFRAAGDYDNFDVDSHTFGLIASAAMYDDVTGSTAYRNFTTAQRDWLFGANAWGASFMVGEGTDFPRCMQHQVANLSGSRNGSPPIDVGAVVNGPNASSLFDGGLGSRQQGMRKCPTGSDPYSEFTGSGSRYVDDVRAWQTSEPALDMTGTAVLAGALEESLGHL